MNYKALDINKFRKLIKENGCYIKHTTKHLEIIDKEGNRVMVFAISHRKNGKDYVKPNYVRDFNEIIGE